MFAGSSLTRPNVGKDEQRKLRSHEHREPGTLRALDSCLADPLSRQERLQPRQPFTAFLSQMRHVVSVQREQLQVEARHPVRVVLRSHADRYDLLARDSPPRLSISERTS